MSRVAKKEETRQYDVALGQRISLTRRALNMKSKELARAAGISPSGLYSYEAGLTSCPPVVLARVARAFGVSVSALMPKFTSYCFPEDCRSQEVKSV